MEPYKKHRSPFPRKALLGELQDLIGGAQAAYENDRAADRADRVLSKLRRAFEIILEVRGHDYPNG